MSDIIQDAKQLQSELQSERADWVRMRGGIDIEMPLDCTVLYGDEEARDVIGALAEETYFYGVQVWMGGRWIMMLTSNYGTSLMYRGKWFERKDEAEECAAKWNHDTPTRIVRQRRSPVEVINE